MGLQATALTDPKPVVCAGAHRDWHSIRRESFWLRGPARRCPRGLSGRLGRSRTIRPHIKTTALLRTVYATKPGRFPRLSRAAVYDEWPWNHVEEVGGSPGTGHSAHRSSVPHPAAVRGRTQLRCRVSLHPRLVS